MDSADSTTLDAIIAQFRAIKADIDAREAEIQRALPGRVMAKAGQARLAEYAASLMVKPGIEGDQSVAALAAAAWSDLADI